MLSDLGATPPDPAPFEPLPSFWSDQYDLRLQSFGALGIADRTEVLEGGLEREAGGDAVVGYYRGDHLVGAALLGFPRKAVPVRRMVLAALSAARSPGPAEVPSAAVG